MRSKIVDFLHSKFGQNLLRPTIEIRGNYSCIKSHVKKRKGKKRRIQDNAENFCKTITNLYCSDKKNGNFRVNFHFLEI